ncbi:hypothetical protein E3P86_00998 [Wallemia ichthyophaga]|uniref:Peroxisomal ATPase PEX1 n=1 Tax=Wallemia ichthyophaga TaxID=245174 RepID=A0A4T0JA77_WALIC|nr:hypothetical protein E3P86_00998 [Wallemia ichthyophaga]
MPEIKYTQLGSSLVNLPPSIYSQLVAKGSRPQSLAVIIRHGDREYYLGWSGMASSIATLAIEDFVEIDPVVAAAYRLDHGANVSVSLHSSLPTAKSVNVVPDTPDDWELLEAHAEYVEQNLLSQVRLASTHQPMVVYLPSKSSMTFRVEATDPATSFSSLSPQATPAVRLDRDTDVAFAPKLRRPPPSSSASSTIRPTPTPVVHSQDDQAVQQLARVIPARVYPRTEPGLAHAHPALVHRLCGQENDSATVTLTRLKSPLTRYNDKRKQGGMEVEPAGLTLGMGGAAALKNATSKPVASEQERELALTLTLSLVADDTLVDGHVALPLGSHQRLQLKQYELVSCSLSNSHSNSQILYHDYDILAPLFSTADDDILPGHHALVEEAADYLISSIGMSLSKLKVELKDGYPGDHSHSRSLGLLIIGGSSTGKTTLAKTIAYHISQDVRIFAHSLYEDVSGWVQEKASTIDDKLRLLLEEAHWSAPTVIILDGLDVLLTPESETDQNTTQSGRQRTLADLFARLFSPCNRNLPQGVVVVGVASGSLHSAVNTSRVFGKEIKLLAPSKTTRREMLLRLFDEHRIADFSGVNTLLIASEMEGYLPVDVTSVLERAVHHASLTHDEDGPSSTLQLHVATHHFEAALAQYRPQALRGVNLQQSSVKWGDIGGMRHVKGMIRETLEWPTKYALLFDRSPLRLRAGLLLYGYPGCGKTVIASAVARECGLNLISVKGPELLNKYIGQSEATTRSLFDRAKAAKPCVLFFDEFDSIAPRRGHDSTGVTDRVVNQLLTQMDGAEGLDSGVFVLAATSRPDLVDPALLRPGRLDKALLCDMPDLQDRVDYLVLTNTPTTPLQILAALTRSMHLDADIDLASIAARCEQFTGADLQALVYNAHLECVHEVLAKREEVEAEKREQHHVERDDHNDHSSRENEDEDKAAPGFSWSFHSDTPLTRSGEKEVDARIERLLSAHTAFGSRSSHPHSPHSQEKTANTTATSPTPHVITAEHISKAFAITHPSVSSDEIARLRGVYDSFTTGRPSQEEPKTTTQLTRLDAGQTEWSQNGRHTGTTDIGLTQHGAEVVEKLGPRVVGDAKLIDPGRISHVLLSPRKRAIDTFTLLFKDNLPAVAEREIVEDAREWTYGDYEGLKPAEIKARNPHHWIWTDGCPNGESAADVSARADNLVRKIRDIHAAHLLDRERGVETKSSGDVVIFSHGHFSRVFISRFLGFGIGEFGPKIVAEAGAVQLLGYQHNSLDEPSILAMNLQ